MGALECVNHHSLIHSFLHLVIHHIGRATIGPFQHSILCDSFTCTRTYPSHISFPFLSRFTTSIHTLKDYRHLSLSIPDYPSVLSICLFIVI